MTDSKIQAVISALQVAIQTERDGYHFYQEAAAKTQDPRGKDLFRSLARDEIAHENILQIVVRALEEEGEWEAAADSVQASASSLAEGTPVFSRERIAADASAYTYELSALRTAYLIEKDAVAFYTRAAQQTDDRMGKAAFEELAEMERAHLRILEEEYNFLARQFELDMGFAPF